MTSFNWRKSQIKLFWYWINERHRIYLKKKDGDKFPWTKDKILQQYKFTNVYRQLDAVTQAWTQRYVTLLSRGRALEDADILFQCAQFRLFNWPETYDALHHGLSKWNYAKAVTLLTKRQTEDHEQIFTGAYIIPNAGRTDPKIEVICEALNEIYHDKELITKRIRKARTMEGTVEILQEYPTVGGFIAYEIACDLRHTRVLHDARDVLSWANPGPGAQRGIHRLLTGSHHRMSPRPDYVVAMRQLYTEARPAIADESALNAHVWQCEWPFEMREIEHSLCEFDKYMRVKNGEGRPRSIYRPKIQRELEFE